MDSPEILTCQGGSRLGTKLDDESGGASPPALPPRPPPRPRNIADPASPIGLDAHLKRNSVKKYVFLCSVCGGLASLLGTLFLAVYLILRTYTSSLDYFETIPTYIPATMLMVTGLAVMCLARRRNRYIFLIKLCGMCCLMCVGTCVMVTVTTTVVHMSRLQSLRECVYTVKTQTCTCYSVLLESASERTDEGSRYVFNATPDCEAIHGALYSCLRALFGLSVIGILVCIFCCMLVYQLLSHERKKMYWEQLELRCRYLYGQASNPVRTAGLAQAGGTQTTQHCACCQQFRYQQDLLAWESSDNSSWNLNSYQPARIPPPLGGCSLLSYPGWFWGGGQVGNLYSPNPVGDECVAVQLPEPSSSGWSWRRLPWSRQTPNNLPPPSANSHRSSNGYHQPLNCSSPDSQYGFSSEPGHVATVSSGSASYTVIEPVVQNSGQMYHWGPPPPYSDPNSPSRPVLCPPGPHHHHCQRTNNSGGEREASVNDESSRVLQLRIPSRRPELPMSSSSSSSIKSNAVQNSSDLESGRHPRVCQRQELKSVQRAEESNWNDCKVSPRIKYLNNRIQNTTANTSRKHAQELTESEVYFGDVSSCNVSVRNDSMSIYGEAIDSKHGAKLSDQPQEFQKEETVKKQLNFVPADDNKSPCIQKTVRKPQENPRSHNIQSPNDVNSFQRIRHRADFPYSAGALEGSEDDDPELVNFSQRQASLKGRLPYFRAQNANKIISEGVKDLADTSEKSPNEFPSPMSMSSPSTVSKITEGFYAEVVNSDNGSSDSVWSGYSPDLLAPDAQYEVIPEHRNMSFEDLNGNPNDSNEHRSRLKLYLLSKKRQYPPMTGENWTVNNSLSKENHDFSDRQKCSGYNMNCQKNADRSKDLIHKIPRSSECCLADILNSPKSNYKNKRFGLNSNNNQVNNFSDHRCSEFPQIHDQDSPVSTLVKGLYRTTSENDSISCDRSNHGPLCNEETEMLNPQDISENEVPTSARKVIERVKLTSSNFVNIPSDISENIECFHSDNKCRCLGSADYPESKLNHVRPVDV